MSDRSLLQIADDALCAAVARFREDPCAANDQAVVRARALVARERDRATTAGPQMHR